MIAKSLEFRVFTQEQLKNLKKLLTNAVTLPFLNLGLLVHLCLFHIYINAIGITTYEYVRAHRVALERSAREMSEPTTSTTGALGVAANNPAINPTANGVADDGWNEDDDGSLGSECPQKCRRLCVRVQIEPAPPSSHPTLNGHPAPGSLNVPEGDNPENESLNLKSVPKISFLERTDSESRYKPRPPPVPMPSVSTVPRLPLILSVDGVSRKFDEDEVPAVKDIDKVSKHLDRVSRPSEFRDHIYIIDGD